MFFVLFFTLFFYFCFGFSLYFCHSPFFSSVFLVFFVVFHFLFFFHSIFLFFILKRLTSVDPFEENLDSISSLSTIAFESDHGVVGEGLDWRGGGKVFTTAGKQDRRRIPATTRSRTDL